MDTQNWYGMLRYAFSFWERRWYNFYRLEADHDRFANIDYRIVPSCGIGYWFSDKEDYKAMAELAAQYGYNIDATEIAKRRATIRTFRRTAPPTEENVTDE